MSSWSIAEALVAATVVFVLAWRKFPRSLPLSIGLIVISVFFMSVEFVCTWLIFNDIWVDMLYAISGFFGAFLGLAAYGVVMSALVLVAGKRA